MNLKLLAQPPTQQPATSYEAVLYKLTFTLLSGVHTIRLRREDRSKRSPPNDDLGSSLTGRYRGRKPPKFQRTHWKSYNNFREAL